jgi:hypothetical protein
MASSKRISRSNASFPGYLDFQKLRKEGIAHCQALASDLWTDFNLHDPGLTILEVLCYALTDLGYRTNLPIADLIARSPQRKQEDQALAGGDGKSLDDNFFTAEQILTCNPVTMLDLRKLVIDVAGVRNAWIERADRSEIPIYLNHESLQLQYDPPAGLTGGDGAFPANGQVAPDGLYMVYLELDDEQQPDACGVAAVPLQRMLDDVKTLLHRHRNLCEDFVDVVVLGEEQVALCVDIEIKASANPADVLLQMYKNIGEFLSPTIRFYSLQEMLARGKRIEEIYEGRPLTPLLALAGGCPGACSHSHGFIDTAELERTERRTELHASDLYQIIMQLQGVAAVRKLSMISYINGIPQTQGEKWCLSLTPKHRQSFDLQSSKITFFKDPLSFPADDALVKTVHKRFDEERKARAKAPLAREHLDSAPPEGKYRLDLGDYHSIMHDFPRVYGIGDGEIEKTAPRTRKAQVHQLRAYLLVYDQILANYLAQLANLRELFSMQPDRSASRTNRTYFTQALADVPGLKDLLRDYPDYPDYLDAIAERPETYAERRNRFLDHLLARFAESFTDYVLLMFSVNGQRPEDERFIRDKTNFLVDYPQTSRERGKGFDYSQPEVWDTDNVSGLNRRVTSLLGLGSPECESESMKQLVGEKHLRRTLCHTDVSGVGEDWQWTVEIDMPDVAESDPLVLRSHRGFTDEAAASEDLALFRNSALDFGNCLPLTHSWYTHFGFSVLQPESEGQGLGERPILASFPRLFPPSGDEGEIDAARNATMDKVVEFFAKQGESGSPLDIDTLAEDDGFYFVVTVDISELGITKFRSLEAYATEEDANQAASRFVSQAAKRTEYKKYSRDGFVHHGLAVVDANRNLLAKVAHPWPTAEQRDLYLVQLLQIAYRGSVRCDVFEESEDPKAVYCADVTGPNGELLLAGMQMFESAESADEGRQAIARMLRRREGLRRTADAGGMGLYGIDLVDERGRVVARDLRYFATSDTRDQAFHSLRMLLRDGAHAVETKGGGNGFGFRLVADVPDIALISTPRYPDARRAYFFASLLSFRLQDQGAYGLLDAGSGQYRLVLRDPDGMVTAESEPIEDGSGPDDPNEPQGREKTRDAFIAEAQKQPQWSTDIQQAEPAYRCRLTGEGGRLFLEGEQAYPTPEEAWKGCEQLAERAQQQSGFRLITAADAPLYGFELMDNEGQSLAAHPGFYRTEEERDTQILAVKCLAGTEGLHLVEHLLLRPGDPGSIAESRKGDALLPVARDCAAVSAPVSWLDVDPYSFRATVVVPYWPQRFRKIEFRRFFERTLRAEVPAHVFLRICWVNPHQMRTFESAYQQWLQALVDRSCNRTASHNALVEILFSLRNVYDEGRLSGDTAVSESPLMILDQTKLGTAGVPHDELQ